VTSFATAGSPAFVADAAALSQSSELAAARAAMLAPGVTMSDAIVDAVAELDAIVYQGAAILDTPAALALQLQAAFALAADIDVLDLITAAAGAVAAVVGTVAGQQIADNAAAMSRLFVAAALTAQARIALDVAWDNYTDAAAFRDRFVERADRAAAAGDDAEFVALRDLAGAVADDIEARAASLAQLVTEPIASPVSAFELAQRLYGDGSRADEILARNDSPHAGFLLGDLLVKSQ
jgi:prophage DNA circulation protein